MSQLSNENLRCAISFVAVTDNKNKPHSMWLAENKQRVKREFAKECRRKIISRASA